MGVYCVLHFLTLGSGGVGAVSDFSSIPRGPGFSISMRASCGAMQELNGKQIVCMDCHAIHACAHDFFSSREPW